MSRLELVTECEHGSMLCHSLTTDEAARRGSHGTCHVGRRIPLDPERVLWRNPELEAPPYDLTVQDVLDALEET